MHKLLIVDDKDTMRSLLTRIFQGKGFEIVTAENGSKALAVLALESSFDVVISDIQMPELDGLSLLREIKRRTPGTEVILMTAYAEVGSAIEAMKAGAFDYLVKPFDPDEVELVVHKALELVDLRSRTKRLRRELEEARGFGPFIGSSEIMQRVYYLIDKAAAGMANILVSGESGTGKELVARSIHQRGARKDGPFIAINCGALPLDLAESELFGHVKGAFTGAVSGKPGLFEEAAKGTIFLDEINSLPLPLQVKLNRAIEEREGRRVGATKPYDIDVRIVAATNADLNQAVQDGTFRENLFFRLNVLLIDLPPLRDRKEDIPSLAEHFLKQLSGESTSLHLATEALKSVIGYSWPGNVRELRNAMERAAAVTESDVITPEDLPPNIVGATPDEIPHQHLAKLSYQEACDFARDRMMSRYLTALMIEYGGKVTAAAQQAGITRETLHRLLKKNNISPADYRDSKNGDVISSE